VIPPPGHVLAAYGLRERPQPMAGGRVSGAWKVGDAVLKRVADTAEQAWLCQVYLDWRRDAAVRVPRPLPDQDGRWVVDGWSAHLLVPGTTASVVEDPAWFRLACDSFLDITADLAKPAFLDSRDDPWTTADRMLVTGAEPPAAVGEFVGDCLRDNGVVNGRSQVVHADLTGNVLRDGDVAGVIDWPVQWWPRELALAVVVVDALCWQCAGAGILDDWDDVGAAALRRALAWRAMTRALLDPAPDLSRERATLAIVERCR
jgi:hypothetical protein